MTQQEAFNARRRVSLQQPDYRNKTHLGDYQFVQGYTSGGAQMCVHLTREAWEQQCALVCGPGRLVEDAGVFYYERQLTNDEAPFVPGETVSFCALVGTVVENHGSSGVVDMAGGGERVTLQWTFQGMKVERAPVAL